MGRVAFVHCKVSERERGGKRTGEAAGGEDRRKEGRKEREVGGRVGRKGVRQQKGWVGQTEENERGERRAESGEEVRGQ